MKKILGKTNPLFLGNEMQDASEVLSLLLTQLKESLEHLGSPNIVTSTFYYEIEERFKCMECKNIDKKRKIDLSIWCDPDMLGQTDISIQDLIKGSFKAEKLEKKCIKCTSKYAEVKNSITQLPSTFIIYLKRHKYSNEKRRIVKIKTKVVITPTITVASLVGESVKAPKELSEQDLYTNLSLQEDRGHTSLPLPKRMRFSDQHSGEATLPVNGDSYQYQLQSIVSHQGPTATSGHYVADVFRFDVGDWVNYNDSKVTRTSLETVTLGSNRDNCYILSYLHRPLWNKMIRGK